MPRRNIVKDLKKDLTDVNRRITDLEIRKSYIATLIFRYDQKEKENKE